MQKVLDAAEMRQIDSRTSEKYGIPSLLLMENAAHSAARAIAERFDGDVCSRTVLIFCGTGNNGGDGAALARILWMQGADVEVCLFGKLDQTQGDARINFDILEKISNLEGLELTQADLAFEEITTLEEWLEYDSLNFHCDDPEVIVDALLGTGLTRPLEGIYEQAAAYIDAFSGKENGDTLVVSLDVPSGLYSDNSTPEGTSVCADLTVTFTAPKLANVMPPASNRNGELVVANIGSPCELVNNSPSQIFLAEREDAADWLGKTKFTSGSYKRKRGHALLIAGSANYSGASVLCGNAAMRSGCGLVTIAVPESSLGPIASRVEPEVMVRGIAETKKGAVSEKAFTEIAELWQRVDAVAIGTGLSETDASTGKFVRKILENRKSPVILDADALNLLAPFNIKGSDLLPLILTPHEGEFLRLLGTHDRRRIKDRIESVRKFAQKHNVILVLKGERNLIASPDGRVVINPTGNSGLGKAGNGDTLTGIIAGFVAQAVQMKTDIFETVVAAVYIAGSAGDLAEKKFGKRVMTASDVKDCLAETFQSLVA